MVDWQCGQVIGQLLVSDGRGYTQDRPGVLTEPARSVLGAIKGHHLEAFFMLALQSGARRGEMLGLRWSDLDLDKGEMHIERSLLRIAGKHQFRPTKTSGSVRKVLIADEVCTALRAHKARQAEGRLAVGPQWVGEQWGGLVFCDAVGAPIDASGVSKQFKKVLVGVGRSDLSLKNARHTSATLTYAETGDLKAVQARLGHAALGTTSRFYADVPEEVARKASDASAHALFGTRSEALGSR
ncbi:MAG: site-specific integrase [Chloroflexi bacterium]|nr:MAG: site-specific integrase [Chloroflexota bacterium]